MRTEQSACKFLSPQVLSPPARSPSISQAGNEERVRQAKDDETQEGCLDGSAILDTTKNYNMVSVYLP